MKKEIKKNKKLYFGQYNRMKKFYNLIKEPNSTFLFNNPYQDYSLYQDDIYYTFFMHCYHLKDWIIKSGVSQSKVENFINDSLPLSVSADLCTYSKHAEITEHIRKSSNIRIKKRAIIKNINGPAPTTSYFFCEINVDDKIYDALELTTKCIQEWDRFFIENKLPIPGRDRVIHFDE